VIAVPHPDKEFTHPKNGKLSYKTSAMNLEAAPEVRLVVYTPII